MPDGGFATPELLKRKGLLMPDEYHRLVMVRMKVTPDETCLLDAAEAALEWNTYGVPVALRLSSYIDQGELNKAFAAGIEEVTSGNVDVPSRVLGLTVGEAYRWDSRQFVATDPYIRAVKESVGPRRWVYVHENEDMDRAWAVYCVSAAA
ncbi:MAG: hypothetical protein AAGD32_17530 [Planctomycetota bacterium]